jgi:5-methylcytosine-specific restriction protein A
VIQLIRARVPKPLERRERNRESDARRRADKPWRAFYNTARWKRRRLDQLTREPLCQRCKAAGLVVPATVAHHVERHGGDPIKFFEGELASSCADCHDTIEQAIEARGYEAGCDVDGRPVASDHPWNSNR